jgi:hypothetical protein
MFRSLKLAFVACSVSAFLLLPIVLPMAASFGQAPMNQNAPINVPVQAAWDEPPHNVTLHATQSTGGVIQLSAFGWLEPYVDSAVQGLIVIFFGWFGKSAIGKMLDQSARDALETFAKNSASSLLADGMVEMRGKTVTVDSKALAMAADAANARIPDALKRFGITPQLVADKIVDAIPQTPAGAQIVAKAHQDAVPMPVVPSAS